MELTRTVIVDLDVTDDQADLLDETIEQFLDAANYVVDVATSDESDIETRSTILHEQTYDDVRSMTELHSNHVQSARRRATQALDRTLSDWSRGRRASLPTFSSRYLDYNQRTATFDEDSASLATVDGRIDVDYRLPDDVSGTPHERYLFDDRFETTGATLHPTTDGYRLHLRTTAEVDDPDPRPKNSIVLGVDLGIEQLAVTSTGRFWSGDELEHWRREYERRRQSLQECGTRWAHENVQAVGRTETNRFEQYLHTVANEIVEEAVDHDCSMIAFEDLTDIRDRMPDATRFHAWAFRRIQSYVTYKAREYGIETETVDPEHTSQRCSTCGHIDSNNRHSRSDFKCVSCGYENHADYNAAKNIGYRLLRNQTGGEGGAPVGVRLNSGMLNANGIESLPETARAGVHAESPRL